MPTAHDSLEPASSEPRDHFVLTYTDDMFLARLVADFFASGLALNEAAIAIATPAHLQTFHESLIGHGVAVDAAMERGQIVFLDAELTMARFMTDDAPDPAAFLATASETLGRVRAAGFAKVRAFGEMVDLLWRRNLQATARLEGLWNEVLAGGGVSLVCAYRVEPLTRHSEGVLHDIVGCHSRMLPDQHADDFEAAVHRAYDDVFGASGDAGGLRELLATRRASMPAMSRAHTSLFALREISPSLADQVVERGREHYHDRRRRTERP